MGSIRNQFGKRKPKLEVGVNRKTQAPRPRALLPIEKIVSLPFDEGREPGDWRDVPRLVEVNSMSVWASEDWNHRRDPTGYEKMLSILPAIECEYHGWDIVTCWYGTALAVTGHDDEAWRMFDVGLDSCARKSLILAEMGHVMYDRRSINSLGWWMRACMLGISDWPPYLFLSVAAKSAGFEDLSASLLAATDLVYGGLRLSRSEEDAMYQLVQANKNKACEALSAFAVYMAQFLPPPDFLPEHSHERSLYRTPGDPDVVRIQAKQRLLSRSRNTDAG